MLSAALALASCAACLAVLLRRLLGRRGTGVSAGPLERTETELALLFIFVPASRLRLAAASALMLVAATGWGLGMPWAATLALAGSTALAPRFLVGLLRRRWRTRIAAQLPDALALWAGLLRAGQAMAPALGQLAARQPDPLGAELRLVLSQHRLGVSLDAAIARFRDRAGVADLRMLATLLRAQRELGGNLAEPLERLAALLRSRLAMEARIQSLTAQGRLQGLVVGSLPLLLAAVLAFMEPEAMRAMVTTPVGWASMAVVVTLETAGFALIRRIVNIDV